MANMKYCVKPQDNLYKIAILFGVPLRELAKENQLYHNGDVYPGKKITIPIFSITAPYPYIKKGDVGHYVKLAQQILITLSIYKEVASGIYDENTEMAVQKFKQIQNLSYEEGVGWETWKELLLQTNIEMIV